MSVFTESQKFYTFDFNLLWKVLDNNIKEIFIIISGIKRAQKEKEKISP